jgi:hypothetical protein
MSWQASHFQPGQLRLTVEHHPAEVTHDAVKVASQVFDRSADIASLGREWHGKGVRFEPCAIAVQIDLVPHKQGWGGGYRPADLWCVNPSRTVHRVSPGAIASSNAQVSESFLSTPSTVCRAVSARLGTLAAQRGFGRQAFGCA